jgi:hypothetical protein
MERVPGVSVLRIQLQVLGQAIYPLGQQSYLDLHRPAIVFLKSELGDDFSLFLFVHYQRLPDLVMPYIISRKKELV